MSAPMSGRPRTTNRASTGLGILACGVMLGALAACGGNSQPAAAGGAGGASTGAGGAAGGLEAAGGGAGGSGDIGGAAGGTAGASGASGGAGGAPVATCTGDLSGIGTGDFEIAFTITTTAAQLSAVLNQRDMCTYGSFWSVRLKANGHLVFETDDTTGLTDYTSYATVAVVNDGVPHAIDIRRIGGQFAVTVDGAPDGGKVSAASFGALMPLQTSPADPCIGMDDTVALVGTVSVTCVGPLTP